MGVSRRGQPQPGATLKSPDGSIQILSFKSQGEYGPMYSVQLSSQSKIYELRIFSEKWVVSSKKASMRDHLEVLKKDEKVIRQWEEKSMVFVLLVVPKALCPSEENETLFSAGQRSSFIAADSIQTETQSSAINASAEELCEESLCIGPRDGNCQPKESNIMRREKPASTDGIVQAKAHEEEARTDPKMKEAKPDMKRDMTVEQSTKKGSNSEIAESTVCRVEKCEELNTPSSTTVSIEELFDYFSPARKELYSKLALYYPGGKKANTHVTDIRLIEIQPASRGDALVCRMFCTTLQDKAQYVALSYNWGNPFTQPIHDINVEDCKIRVTESLRQVLLELRKPKEPVVLWADGLCIDQANIPEKNYQVTQMWKIYSNAQEVVAWLGESTLLSDNAMELAKLTGEDLEKKARCAKYERAIMLENLQDLFCRKYWTRVWVIQELASISRTRRPCTIRCGEKTVTLNQFSSFYRTILRETNKAEFKAKMLPRTLVSLSKKDDSRTLLDLLWELSSSHAEDPRDRIYGIRGITPKFYRKNINVDYTMEFDVLTRRVMTLMISRERNLDILCYFQRYDATSKDATSDDATSDDATSDDATSNNATSNNATSNDATFTHPSWLLDICKRNAGIAPNMYSCDKGRKANAKIVNDILRTRGVRIGRVAEIKRWSWKLEAGPRHESDLRAIESLAVTTLRTLYPHENDRDRDNRFLEMFTGRRQLVMDKYGRETNARWRNIWSKRVAFEKGIISSKEWEKFKPQFRNLYTRIFDRCAFTTTEGHVGLGPLDLQTGDLVCVIFGSSLPLILRKDGRYYTFVGPAYLDGAMSGALVEDSDKGDRFWIR